jgi:hypothetical protein
MRQPNINIQKQTAPSLMAKFHVTAMYQFDDLKKALLTKKDEEYQMLLEVAEEFIHQEREKTAQKKSGAPTEVVIREHLLRRGFNVTFNPNIKLVGSNKKNKLFLLKSTINPDQKEYSPNEVNLVIEIKNDAVANQSEILRKKFDELRKLSSELRFLQLYFQKKRVTRMK